MQGAAEPFYTTPEGGEEFTLAGPTHFCRAIGTGGWQFALQHAWQHALGLAMGKQAALRLGVLCIQRLSIVLPRLGTDGCPAPWRTFPAAAATMKKEEEVKLVVKPECEQNLPGRGALLWPGVPVAAAPLAHFLV